jgi:LmbE family N-acetylglucosaminyl deacetylase
MVQIQPILEQDPVEVTVITAHPDDLEIGCGGTLLKLQDQGATITSIITIKASSEVNVNRSASIVSSELVESYALSGFYPKIFNTPLHKNGRPDLQFNNNNMTELGKLIEKCDLAIVHNPNDYHQDHQNTFNLAWPILQKKAREVWLMQSWPYCYQYTANDANLFHSIDWERKRKLLECYGSYLTTGQLDQIKTLNKMWGGKAGCEYAEAFTIKYKYVN